MKANVYTSMMSLVLMAGMMLAAGTMTAQTMQGRTRPGVATTNGTTTRSNNNSSSRRPEVSAAPKSDNRNDHSRPSAGSSHSTDTRGKSGHSTGNTGGTTHVIPKPKVQVPSGSSHHSGHSTASVQRMDWSRPTPPPAREYRPVAHSYYRPVMPASYRPLYSAPAIDRILGLRFGSYYNSSLDYLYRKGYYIDGWYNGTIYLRDVNLLGSLWTDVMLGYDSYNRLEGAEFTFSTAYNDRTRYNSVYRSLCNTYGAPVNMARSGFEASVTWWGGNATGFVTLSYSLQGGRFYTTLNIGC